MKVLVVLLYSRPFWTFLLFSLNTTYFWSVREDYTGDFPAGSPCCWLLNSMRLVNYKEFHFTAKRIPETGEFLGIPLQRNIIGIWVRVKNYSADLDGCQISGRHWCCYISINANTVNIFIILSLHAPDNFSNLYNIREISNIYPDPSKCRINKANFSCFDYKKFCNNWSQD